MPDYSEQLNQDRGQDKARELEAKKKTKKKTKRKIKKPASQPTVDIADVEWIFLFAIAMFADLLGPAGFVFIPVLLFWYVMRFHRFPTKKFIGAGMFEALSLGFLPGWTGFVVVTFFEEKGYLPNWIPKRFRK